jgi:hypothetical protein
MTVIRQAAPFLHLDPASATASAFTKSPSGGGMTSFRCVSVWSWRAAGAWVARFATALAVMLPWFSSAYAAITGRWTPSVDWSGGNPDKYAVHLVLLPGDGAPYHSRVLWWAHDRGGTVFGGQMGWKPGSEGCAAFPSTSFDALGLPTSGMDIFCGGHIQMPDGRLLTIGGTDPLTADYGENQTRIFSPGAGSAAGTWTNPGSMKNWRWYSGSVALNDGRLVAMSGKLLP